MHRLVGLVLGGLAFAACGEPLVVLDEALVDARLDYLTEEVPYCVGESGTARTTSVDLQAALEALIASLGPPPPDSGSQVATGSCGGGLWFWSDHARGNTDYVATFEEFCVESQEGPLVVDGVFEATEHGTPTSSGPMISAFEMRTRGPVDLKLNGEPMSLSVDRVTTSFGQPATWSPDPPTAERPDRTRIGRITLTLPDGNDLILNNLQIQNTARGPDRIEVLGGDLALSGEGRVGLRTAPGESIAVDTSRANVFEGTIELHGARGTVLRVSPRQGRPGNYDLELDGVPFHRSIDCGRGVLPVMEIALAVVSVFPSY